MKLGNFQEANADYTSALELDWKNADKTDVVVVETRSQRALTSFMIKRYEQTIEDTTYVLARRDEDILMYRLRGLAHVHRDEVDEGYHDLQNVLRIDPNDQQALKYKNKIEDYWRE